MNTPRNEKIKGDNRIVNFTGDVFGVLGSEHRNLFNNGKNKLLDCNDRLRKTVKEVREEIGFDYNNLREYERKMVVNDKTIEETKKKLRNHPKLKPLFEEYKTIPGISKSMENKIWTDIMGDLLYESMDDIGKNNGKVCNLISGLLSKTIIDIKVLFNKLSDKLKSLDVSDNELGEKFTGKELKEAFCILPKGLKGIYLRNNNLGNLNGEELKEIFSKLSRSLKICDLSLNNLGEKTGKELKEAFSALPTNLKILNLWDVNLGAKIGEELKEILFLLPKRLKYLNLSENNLGFKWLVGNLCGDKKFTCFLYQNMYI